jgi:ABC-type polysaccharide/polyol phosphate transport system ATPase subunit
LTPGLLGALSERPVVIDAAGIGKKYDLHRHRTILLKDAARLALGFGGVDKDVFWALRDVSFRVRRGETVGIVGANGAGKSTLLSLIAKTAWPTEGSIDVQGRVSALLELGAGFHPDFTGRENIYVNGSVMGLTKKQLDERMDRIIGFSELGPFIDEPVRNYSSGMLARLGFSVATEVDPDILIVDEVLAVGDQSFQEKSFNRILEFQKRGTTIVFVSHSLDSVQRICNRAILLSHGQVLADGAANDVAREYSERVGSGQLDAKRPAYEKERIPFWKRGLAALALAGVVGLVGYLGFRYVLADTAPEQKPPAHIVTPRDALLRSAGQ